MGNKTVLYQAHVDAGAKIVDFAGWDMPIHYGSQLEEHKKVREDAGMFDVSHMTVVDIKGSEARAFLRKLLANDVAKLQTPGKALYSCMLNEQGGIVDDLICYYLADDFYRLVVNAATREKDLAWIQQQARHFAVTVEERRDYAIIAVQGPNAREKTHPLFPADQLACLENLKPFQAAWFNDWLIARTGYTGENGYEIILPATAAEAFWKKLLQQNVQPCGLGARDTLRLEAGLNLYGTDMDESTSPLVSNLAWTVAWEPADRDFIGKAALLEEKAQGVKHRLVGLILEDKGVLRSHLNVEIEAVGRGETTSGSFSPVLGKAIALARVPAGDAQYARVEIRGKWLPVRIVKPPFVRK